MVRVYTVNTVLHCLFFMTDGGQVDDVTNVNCVASNDHQSDGISIAYLKPNQPLTNGDIPQQVLSKTANRGNEKKLSFQVSWFTKHTWLHFCPNVKGMLCFYCMKASQKDALSLATKRDDAFCSVGFTNWKNAIERFKVHELSQAHMHAVSQLQQMKAMPVDAQISVQKATEQAKSRVALTALFSTIKFLARQGIALRGHESIEGNYMQLLLLRSNEIPELKNWLARTTNYTSSDSQNEMLAMLSHDILRKLITEINATSQFAIIVDGTQDISGKEQESICLRYVDKNLDVHETFVGLYEPPATTGAAIATVVEDVLLRFGLPIFKLRGQTYDGAANMSGHYNGCQALIAEKQPLALFVHCGAHSANLVVQHTVACTPQLRDAVQWVQELGTLYGRSLKYKKIFAEVAVSESHFFQTLKPLCPTRWLCRTPAIRCVVTQYKVVLKSLRMFSKSANPETAAKANGLLDRFEDGTTLLMLQIALHVCTPLENLNKALQAESATLNGMMQAAQTTLKEFQRLRKVAAFRRLFNKCKRRANRLGIDITAPRPRKPPAKYTGRAAAYEAPSAEEHYRALYYIILDNAAEQLRDRFDGRAAGLCRYLGLERMLLSGVVDDALVEQYPELDKCSLVIQLAMFRNQYTFDNLEQARVHVRTMCPEVRALFTSVEQLIRLLLVCPASSCTAERSFSALRRLKTWLRNNMTQSRLNAVAVCNVHKERIDEVDISTMAKEFAGRSEIRRNIFGNWN